MSSLEISYKSFDFEYDTTCGILYQTFSTKDNVVLCRSLEQSEVIQEIETFVTDRLQTLRTDERSIKNTISYIQNQTVATDIMLEIVAELENQLQDLQLQISDIV